MEKQRIIKFRIWDGSKFYGAVTLHDIIHGYPLTDTSCFSDNLIFQQSAGLKDENGKEIYEGDIISFTQCLFNIRVENYPTKIKKVEWLEAEGKWNVYETTAGEINVKVIGNIFENPELLVSK